MLGNRITAIPLEDFYPFGASADDSFLPPNDDGFSNSILLDMPFPFFGTRQPSVFVSYVRILIIYYSISY